MDVMSCLWQYCTVFDSRFSCEQRLLHQIQQDACALPAHQRLQRANHHGKLSHRGDHVRAQICKARQLPSECGWMSALWRVKVSNSEYLSHSRAWSLSGKFLEVLARQIGRLIGRILLSSTFEKRRKSGEPAIQQRVFGGEPVLAGQDVKSHSYFRVWTKQCQIDRTEDVAACLL